METEIIKICKDNIDLQLIKRAADIIKNGGLVAFPTETVYGLGGDATKDNVAKKIYEAKGRPSDNPLIIHLEKAEDAEKYAYTDRMYYKIANAFMPGPITVILKKKPIIPYSVTGGLESVAVRVPENKIARVFISECGVPIAAPSANLSGKPSPTKASHVIKDLQGRIDAIIDGGESTFGVESTIVKIDDNKLRLLRPGAVSVEMLRGVCDDVELDKTILKKPDADLRPLAPGMKYKHYAPSAPVFMLCGDDEKIVSFMQNKISQDEKTGILCYDEFLSSLSGKYVYSLGKKDDRITQAHKLFDLLRKFDETDVNTIYTVMPCDDGIGLAVHNRLLKACGFNKIDV